MFFSYPPPIDGKNESSIRNPRPTESSSFRLYACFCKFIEAETRGGSDAHRSIGKFRGFRSAISKRQRAPFFCQQPILRPKSGSLLITAPLSNRASRVCRIGKSAFPRRVCPAFRRRRHTGNWIRFFLRLADRAHRRMEDHRHDGLGSNRLRRLRAGGRRVRYLSRDESLGDQPHRSAAV